MNKELSASDLKHSSTNQLQTDIWKEELYATEQMANEYWQVDFIVSLRTHFYYTNSR